jgi:hypothetical protein
MHASTWGCTSRLLGIIVLRSAFAKLQIPSAHRTRSKPLRSRVCVFRECGPAIALCDSRDATATCKFAAACSCTTAHMCATLALPIPQHCRVTHAEGGEDSDCFTNKRWAEHVKLDISLSNMKPLAMQYDVGVQLSGLRLPLVK